MLTRKYYSRLRILISGAFFRLVLSFSNLIISLFIIRIQSPQFWGEIVYYLLILDLGFAVINWGHSFYLVRQFSLNPADTHKTFQKSLASRFYVWELFAIIVLLWLSSIPYQFRMLLIVWSAGRFIYQAFDPVIQYERKFTFATITELIGIMIVIIPFIFSPLLQSVFYILLLFTISFIFRACIVIIYYRKYIVGFTFKIKFSEYLTPAFPFLLLTFSAMLQQRTDLYVVAFFLPSKDTAMYQVYLNLLLLSHVGASLMLSPFAKNIYRLPQSALKQLEKRFILSGFVLALGSILIIYLVLVYIFEFQLSATMYLIGYFYVLMYYVYQVKNYQFMKEQKQKTIAMFSLAGFLLNLCLSLWLTPLLGIEGAMLAGLSTQVLNAILHHTVSFTSPRAATNIL